MDSDSTAAGIVLILSWLLVGLVAAVEVALASISRSHLRSLSQQGLRQAQIVDLLLEDSPRFLVTLMLLKSSALLAAGGAALLLLLKWSPSQSVTVAFLLLVWVMVAVAQISGRTLVMHNAERFALFTAPAIQSLSLLLLPVSYSLRKLGSLLRGHHNQISEESIFLSEDGLRLLINLGESETIIEEGEKQMIASIFEMGDTVVREIMAPRIDIVALSSDTTLSSTLDVIIKAGHSRIPVYEESVDRIIGILYAKDLLKCFRDNRTEVSIATLLRPAYFVPESKKVNELFHEMQKRRVHIAIVVDEYGGTAGLVTIEDLLEEIVGDIQDEYDKETPNYQQLTQETYIFNARLDMDTVTNLLAIEEPYDDADTLGGFIFSQLGHVPETGEQVVYGGWRFIVLSVESRRIRQVRAELLPIPTDDASQPAAALSTAGEEPAGDGPVVRLQTSS